MEYTRPLLLKLVYTENPRLITRGDIILYIARIALLAWVVNHHCII